MPVGGVSRKGNQSDDDDDFFKPSANSTLSKIFGITKSSSPPKKTPTAGIQTNAPTSLGSGKISDRYGASSFRYVPPAPETEVESSSTSKTEAAIEWNLVQACVASAYKLINNENTAQGKLGIALLSSGTDFRILLYRSKTDALATLNITKATKLFLKQDYLQFQSDDESFWSVLFENVAERDRLLATIEQVCSVEQEKLPPPARPVPASRTVPIVEEPESDVDRSKASLISRIARVGQSILPQDKAATAASTTEVSDSSDTDAAAAAAVRIETIPRHRRTGSGSGKMHPVTIGMQMVPSTGQNMLQAAADVNFNMFMAENRMQGTEVRMNLSKLESKLDRVLDKIDLLSVGGGGSSEGKSLLDKDEDILALEEKMLELKKENHMLKGKIRTLEAEGKSIRESSLAKENLLESEEKCRELSEKVALLEMELKTIQNKAHEDRIQIDRKAKEVSLKEEIIESKTKEVHHLEEKLQIAQSKEKEANEANAALETQIQNLQQSLKVVEKQLEDQRDVGTTNKTLLDALVKDIMNSCYQRLSERIDDGRILKIIGQTIKQETKAALERQLPK